MAWTGSPGINCSMSRITKITATNKGIACSSLKRMKRSMPASSGEPEEAGGVAVEPLLDDRILQRQIPIFRDQIFEGGSEQIARQPRHDLVLEQGIAELQELLPARSLLGKITGPVRGGVAVEVRMAAQQSDHLVHPWPAAQTGDDPQLRKVDRYIIDVPWMSKIVGPIVGIIHRRVD